MHLDRVDRMTLDSSDSVGISRFYRGFTLSSNDRKKDFEKISGSKICFETSSNIYVCLAFNSLSNGIWPRPSSHSVVELSEFLKKLPFKILKLNLKT
jgi:hypothetical protein